MLAAQGSSAMASKSQTIIPKSNTTGTCNYDDNHHIHRRKQCFVTGVIHPGNEEVLFKNCCRHSYVNRGELETAMCNVG